ncbi:MAG: serine/threonine-protein kinase [Myxococcota bacterium]
MAATSSLEEQSHRQQRLALFAGVLFIFNGIGGVFQIVTDPGGSLVRPANLVMFTEVALAGFFLVVLRREATFSRRIVDAAEATFLLLTSAITGLFAHAVPVQHFAAFVDPNPTSPEALYFSQIGLGGFVWVLRLSCTLGATLTFALRAAIVPSTARRTLILTALGGVVMSIVMALPIPGWAASARIFAELPFDGLPMIVMVAVWWTLATLSCVAISTVVHGLRQEVRDARRLGQYELESRLGAGGMGVVYRARHALLRRPTAIKLISPDKTSPQALTRFEREVRLTATLTHPNTITIYDFGHTPEGVFYYAMELLEGASLDAIVEVGGPVPPARAVHVLRGVAAALKEAHAAGLIHRDIKPSNIMLARGGGTRDVPKLLDFGLVKQLATEGGGALTEDTALTGTPLYLAPECIRETDAASPLSDLYSLGAVGFFLLTGTHVFTGANVVDICGHHLHTPPERPSDRLGRALPEGLDALVLRCLAKDPAERPESAQALLEALRALDVDPWSDADAERWWAAHEDAMATATRAPTGETQLRIELGKRS